MAHQGISRAAFVAGAAAATTVAGRAATAPLTTIKLAGTPDPDVLAVIWGQRNGIFAKYGLSVEVQRLENGGAVAAAVAGGSLDIGKANIFSLMAAHLRNIPFAIQSAAAIYTVESPIVGFVVGKNARISAGKGLNGKTIASQVLSDLFAKVTAVWIDQTGGDSKTVKFVELTPSAMPAAIAAGRIDGAVMVDPILEQALQGGDCRLLGRPYDIIAKHFGTAYYFSMQDYAAKNADVLARFRRGLDEATKYALAHKSEMVPIIVEYTGLSADLVRHMPLVIASGVALSDIQPVIDFAAKHNLITAAFPATDLVDPAALRGA